ncbi:hypothetical protein MTO96_043434 [Rhipicephalus appendiculatus]
MRANVSVMRDLAQHTRVEPTKRVRNLLEFIGRINGHAEIRQEMDRWGPQIRRRPGRHRGPRPAGGAHRPGRPQSPLQPPRRRTSRARRATSACT